MSRALTLRICGWCADNPFLFSCNYSPRYYGGGSPGDTTGDSGRCFCPMGDSSSGDRTSSGASTTAGDSSQSAGSPTQPPTITVTDSSAPTSGTGYKFVGTPNGDLVRIPETWEGRVANNGRGLVFQDPASIGNANMIRIMDPTARYPQGYVVYTNELGQPLDILGRPGPRALTHIPLDFIGFILGWP